MATMASMNRTSGRLTAMAFRVVRHFCTLALLCTLGLMTFAAYAQDWPTRPVKIIVPYGPGGIADLLVRMTKDRLASVFGQPFVIENRVGGGGVVGMDAAVHATKDGYTLLEAGGSQFSVVPVMHKLNYDPVKELAPIGIIAVNGMALAVNNDLPIHSVKEFIDYAKANPGKLNYATGGVGTSSHLVPAAFAARTGINLVAVPYQSTPQSIVGILAGTCQVFFGNVSDILETARSGRIRLLALSNATRIAQFPDVPTVAETVPGFVMTGWNGYFAPAGTPSDIINRMSKALAKTVHDPEVVATLNKLSLEPVGNTPEEVAETIRKELPVYAEAAQAAGLSQK
jgi:tripartite-type tricarboxylate transporter receptor subunit TctC